MAFRLFLVTRTLALKEPLNKSNAERATFSALRRRPSRLE